MASRFGWLVLGACAPLLGGCGGEDDTGATGEPPACPPGEWLRGDGVCVLAGLPPDMPCPPGEWLRESDGACVPAGVPPDGCGAGFVHDGDRGCEPIQPAAPCPAGLMAAVGETSCREVAPCASGTWGGIAVEPDTEHVDGSYTGGMSDGSQAAPWITIQAGVDAAAPGAVVAVAAASYVEDVLVVGKPVRLWGRCPAMVELRGTGAAFVALDIRTGASGTEVRRLAISGQGYGVLLRGSQDVVVEETWIHDNTGRGAHAESSFGPTSLVVRRSLLERNREIGVYVSGSDATLEATVVRDTLPDAQGLFGRCISATTNPTTGARASVTMKSSLVEQSHESGVLISGSDATLEATVVRDTSPDAQGLGVAGLIAQNEPTTGARASVTVKSSLVERSHEVGVLIGGSDATVEATVVRDTLPNAQGELGRGIGAEDDPTTGARAIVTVKHTLVEQSHELGVFVFGSDAMVEATVVRDTLPVAQGKFGRGIGALDDPATGARASLTVKSSLVERSHEFGVFIGGSDATVEATVVRDTLPNARGSFGRAVQIQRSNENGAAASVTLRALLLERSVDAGIGVFGPATAEIEACIVDGTAPTNQGFLGDGLVVWSLDGPATATLTATRIQQSARAAVSSFGATLSLASSLFVCQGFDIAAEPWQGQPAVLDDRGGVLCGCPEATEGCHAQSYQLEPPQPVGE